MSPLDQPAGLFALLRAATTERLAAADAFAAPNAVPVIDGGRRDIAKTVDDLLLRQRTSGLCLVVTIPKVVRGDAGMNHIIATIVVRIYERPADNWGTKGRQLSVEDAAEAVMGALGFEADGGGWSPSAVWTRFIFEGFRLVIASTDLVGMEVTFTTETQIQIAPSTP